VEKSVFVFAVEITQLITQAFIMLRELQTIETLGTSKESRHMFRDGNARVRSHLVTKTTVNVLGQEYRAVKSANVWTAKMVSLIVTLRD